LLAVMMLDLDGFKVVNDTHGHAVGDRALSEFARRASAILRGDAFLARIGGTSSQSSCLWSGRPRTPQAWLDGLSRPSSNRW
jgi:hypothetical protein